MMKGLLLANTAITCVNIILLSYLILLIRDFHRDAKAIKTTLKTTSDFLSDTWSLTAGSVPQKLKVVGKRGKEFVTSISDGFTFLLDQQKVEEIEKEENKEEI